MNDFFKLSHWIGKFTDNELTPEEEDSLLIGASRNPILRNELRLDREISGLLDDYQRIRLSETIKRTMKAEEGKVVIPFCYQIAASMIILMTLACLTGFVIHYSNQNAAHPLLAISTILEPKVKDLLVLFNGKERQDRLFSPLKRKVTAQPVNEDRLYTPKPEYEFLVGSVMRDVSVIVLSPMPRVSCKSDSLLQFSWRWLNGSVPVSIEVFDIHDRLAFDYIQKTGEAYVLNMNHWARGLYYYKISSGEELITMGSISIY